VWTADKLTAYYTTLADVSGAHMRRSVVRRVSVGSREIWRNNEWNTRYGQSGKGDSQLGPLSKGRAVEPGKRCNGALRPQPLCAGGLITDTRLYCFSKDGNTLHTFGRTVLAETVQLRGSEDRT
jgi:hypothetical protein